MPVPRDFSFLSTARLGRAVFGIASGWLLLIFHLAAAESPASRPNIVFILADDLGYTDVGCYGSRYYETPNIDRLADSGKRFTCGYACGPNCQPTRAALMSGQYMPRTGIYTVGGIERFPWQSRSLRPVDNVTQLAPEKITIAESLKRAGYVTALFGKWHLGEDPQHHPSAQGFDEAITSAGEHYNFETRPPVERPNGIYLADFLTDKAVDFIARRRERPFFLCLHHFAVHAPHVAKPDLVERFKKKTPAGGHYDPVYAAMIASVDESVGRVVAELKRWNLTQNTLVIFTSDNGGVGGYRRESIRAKDVTDNAPLRGGKGMLYEGGVRVPYVFSWPGHIAPGGVCHTPINSVDLYPTLLAVAGAKAPAHYSLDGTEYLSVLTDTSPNTASRPPLFWHFPGYLGSDANTWRTLPVGTIRKGDWKLMEFFEDGRLELYNLRDDLGERSNLASALPERARELQADLHAWQKSMKTPMPTRNSPQRPDPKQ